MSISKTYLIRISRLCKYPVICLLLVLTACNSVNVYQRPSSTQVEETKSFLTLSKTAVAPGLIPTKVNLKEPISIKIWVAFDEPDASAFKNIVEKFNESNQLITIQIQIKASQDEIVSSISKSSKGDEHPTLIYASILDSKNLLEQGLVKNMTEINPGRPYLEEEIVERDIDFMEFFPVRELDYKDIFFAIRNAYSIDRQLYCMPLDNQVPVLYVNKHLLEQSGFENDQLEYTWQEIGKINRRAVEEGNAKSGIGVIQSGWIFEQIFTWHNQPLANQNNGRIDTANQVYINNELSKRFLGIWKQLSEHNLLLTGSDETVFESFIKGELPFLIHSSSGLKEIEQIANFPVQVAKFPKLEGDYPNGNSAVGGGCLWVMDNKSPEEEYAAWEFLKYLIHEDISVEWYRETGYLINSRITHEKIENQNWYLSNPNLAVPYTQIEEGIDTSIATTTLLINHRQIRMRIDDMLSYVVNDDVDVQKALEDAEQDVNSILEEALNSQ